MTRNIFERLRMEKTERPAVERGVGKKVDISKWLTQTELAKKLNISQQTVAKAESGEEPSLNTIKAYHNHFNVPYNTLLGESDSLLEENVKINQELGLSDESIAVIKGMSNKSLAMLNAFLSLDSETINFFSYMADFLTERNIKRMNKDSLQELSISGSVMKDFYLLYLESIPYKKLENVYHLTEDEKAIEYQLCEEGSDDIYISQGESILEILPVKNDTKNDLKRY